MNRIVKVTALLLALSVLLCSLAFAGGGPDPLDYVRVGLYFGDTGLESVELASDYGFTIYDTRMNELGSVDETEIFVTPDTEYDGLILMSSAEDPEERIVSINGKKYRDGVQVIVNGTLRVINCVTMEHYLRGVLNKEMSSSYPAEALKAQAVCCRSFAESCTKHTTKAFDVCATTCCQVYGGLAAEHPACTEACEATAGEMIHYAGKVVPGYFYAYSAGYTMAAEDLWGASNGYCKSVEDSYCDRYDWQTWYSFDEIRQRLLDAGYDDPGEILSVRVSSRLENGAVEQIIVSGSNGDRRLTRSNVMGVLKLKSNFFSLTAEQEDGRAERTGFAEEEYYYVRSADGIYKLPVSQIYITDGHTTSKLENTEVSASGAYAFKEEEITGGIAWLTGIGYGHGVGMSQVGAKNMALAGMDYLDILNHYYTGIDIY